MHRIIISSNIFFSNETYFIFWPVYCKFGKMCIAIPTMQSTTLGLLCCFWNVSGDQSSTGQNFNWLVRMCCICSAYKFNTSCKSWHNGAWYRFKLPRNVFFEIQNTHIHTYENVVWLPMRQFFTSIDRIA